MQRAVFLHDEVAVYAFRYPIPIKPPVAPIAPQVVSVSTYPAVHHPNGVSRRGD